MFKIYAYFNSGDLGVRNPSLDSIGLKNAFSLKNRNFFTNMSFRQFLGKGWKLNTVASVSYNKDNINTEVQNQQNERIPVVNIPVIDYTNFNLDARQWMVQARAVLDKRFGALNTIRFGAEVWNNADSAKYTNLAGTFPTKISDFYTAIYAESDLYLSNNVAFRPGIRIEHSGLLNRWNIAPRAALSYKLDKNSQFSIDYGVFYQTPERRYLVANSDFSFLRADHYILTYQNLSTNYTFRVQAFSKIM
jgi:outer membrane receptor for ferrienterochelin and colicin